MINMVWNVFRYNSNKHVVEEYNVFTHFNFAVAVDKLKKNVKQKLILQLNWKENYYIIFGQNMNMKYV